MVAGDIGDDGVYGCGRVGESSARSEDLGRGLSGCGGSGCGEGVGEKGSSLYVW